MSHGKAVHVGGVDEMGDRGGGAVSGIEQDIVERCRALGQLGWWIRPAGDDGGRDDLADVLVGPAVLGADLPRLQ